MRAVRDLNKLSTFVRVAERLSFTKAARDLRTTPSVVSKHITELEDMLGFSLLSRSTHGVALTEVGERFFKSCLHTLEGLEQFVVAARNVETGPYGILRIQAAANYARAFIVPLLGQFIERYPDLRIELITESGAHNPVDYGCDVIVASHKPNGPGLIGKDIGTIAHVICASPDYLRRCGKPEIPQDLRDHNCLVVSPFSSKEWCFKDGARERIIEVSGTLCSNSPGLLAEFALQGIGIVRIPAHAVRNECASGLLIPLFADCAVSKERMGIYYSKTKYLPAKTTAFIDFLQNAMLPEGIGKRSTLVGTQS